MPASSALFEAIARGDVPTVRQLVASEPGAANSRNNRDVRRPTALHVAAQSGHAAVVRALVKMGADVNSLDTEQTSPLGLAAFLGHLEVATALLDAGAHPSIRNKFGFTPLSAAVAGEQGKWRNYSAQPIVAWQAIVSALRAKGAEL